MSNEIPDPRAPDARERLIRLLNQETKLIGLKEREIGENAARMTHVPTLESLPGLTLLVYESENSRILDPDDAVFYVELVDIAEPQILSSDVQKGYISPRSHFIFRQDGTTQRRVQEHPFDAKDAFVYPDWEAGMAALLNRLAVNLAKAEMCMSQVYRTAYRRAHQYEASEPKPL